jgi:hypothetical protein
VTAILAFVAIPLVLRGSRAAKPAVWVFNVFGTIDLLVAIATATIYNAPVEMGPAYWIPAFWVPLFVSDPLHHICPSSSSPGLLRMMCIADLQLAKPF